MVRTPQAPHPGHYPGREQVEGPIGRVLPNGRPTLPSPGQQATRELAEDIAKARAAGDVKRVGALLDCLSPQFRACVEVLVFEFERYWMTTRGMNVRAPATCMPPVSSSDIDDVKTAVLVDLPPGLPIGGEVVILARTATERMVIKGLGVEFVTPAGGTPADPYSQLRVSLRARRSSIGSSMGPDDPGGGFSNQGPFFSTPVDIFGNSVSQLQPLTALLKQGDTAELVVRRIAAIPPSLAVQFLVSARWKGWQWMPTAETASPATSTIAY